MVVLVGEAGVVAAGVLPAAAMAALGARSAASTATVARV
jgi:hypothetical protein